MSAETLEQTLVSLTDHRQMEGQTSINGRQGSKDDHEECGASWPWDWPLLRAVQPGREALPGDTVLMQSQSPWT